MNGELIIDRDKTVLIKSMLQWQTYDGLLEGLPTTKLNSLILADVKAEALKFCGFSQIYLIEPEQKVIPFEREYLFGEPASLPPIVCVAKLWHHAAFKNSNKDFSSLGLIWFQRDYAFPIEENVLTQIRDIPFSRICGEFAY